MIVEVLLFLVTVTFTFAAYKVAKVDRKYYERRNIKSKSQYAELVDFVKIVFGRLTPVEIATNGYNVFPDEP